MNNIFKQSVLFLVTVSCLTSCVAKRKYLSASSRAEQRESELVAERKAIAALNDSVLALSASIDRLNQRVGELGSENQIASNQLNMTKEQVASQRKKLQQLQELIGQQQRATADLKRKIADALTSFSNSELTVTTKNGKVYISMQESLLFPSGSAKVNPKGKQALSQVANVLNANSDININIEGHTDSVAIHNSTYTDNWDLSVTRATAIAHVLIDEYKVTPARLVASGRSHYDPVNTNSTLDGRAMNRRTEIILEPRLDELMDLINTNDNTAKNR